MGKESAREFQFQHQGSVRARELNQSVRSGDYELVKATIVGTADPYAHIPEDYKRLMGRDGWPEAKVEVATIDYSGVTKVSGVEPGDRIVVERGMHDAAKSVIDELRPELDRLRDAYGVLEKVQSRG